MANASLTIKYAGPALENHEMDINVLAPALLGLSDLIREANKIIYGPNSYSQVNVHGTFQSGSFQVDLSVIQEIKDSLVDLFNSPEVNAALNTLNLLGLTGGGFGLVQLLKWLKGRDISKIQNIDDQHVAIVTIDGDQNEVNIGTFSIFKNLNARKNLHKVIGPLSKEGVEEFRASTNDSDDTVVKKEHYKYYEAPDDVTETLEEQTIVTHLKVVSPSFADGNKWKFTDGESYFFAEINDKEFIDRVNANQEMFVKDDIFKVKLKRKQLLTQDGSMRVENVVEEIIEHRPPDITIRLPLED